MVLGAYHVAGSFGSGTMHRSNHDKLLCMDEFSSGLSERQLKLGYLYAKNQLIIRQALYIIAGLIIALLAIYSLYGMADFGLLQGVRERALAIVMQNDKVDFAGVRERLSPQNLSISDTLTLPAGDGKVDFVARVGNKNAGWAAMVDYSFSYGSAETGVLSDFVLPGEEVALPAYKINDPGSMIPVFNIKELRWMRVSPHDIGAYAPWAASRLTFELGQPTNAFVEVGGTKILRTSFTLKNNGGFSYWNVPILVSLEASGQTSALQTITIDQVKSGETRTVEVSWFFNVPSGSFPKVQAHVNILDPKVYMARVSEAPPLDIREMLIQPIQPTVNQ